MRHNSGLPRPESIQARERRLWPATPRLGPLRFGHAPLLFAAIAFALGEALPASHPTILLTAAATSLALLAVLSLRRAPRLGLLPTLALWTLCGAWARQIEPAPSPQTSLLAYADGLSRTVQGHIVRIQPQTAATTSADADRDFTAWDDPTSAPLADKPLADKLTVDIELNAIEDLTPDLSRMVPIAGGVRATVQLRNATAPTLHCGDTVEAPMRLRLPDRYRDPAAWQYADYLLTQGIAAHANLPAARLHLLSAAPYWSLHCRVLATQTWAGDRILAYIASPANRRLPPALRLSPDDAGMLNAMLFGDRTRLNRQLRLGFERTGSFHLFVVSGMHVALFAAGVLWLTRRARAPLWLATLVTLALTSAYATLTGLGIPVQRALGMAAIFLIARLLYRDRGVLNAFGAAALAVLVVSPHALFEASFQMTFLAIVAIAGIASPLGERTFIPYLRAARALPQLYRDATLPPRLAQFRVMLRLWGEPLATLLHPLPARRAQALPAALVRAALWAAELILIGLIAEAVMALPMALYFHRATVFALPANMLSIPIVAVLVPLGMLTFCASLLGPIIGYWLALLPASATALLLHAVTFAIGHISHTQASDLRVAGPTPPHALAALACIALSCIAIRARGKPAWATAVLLPLAVAAVLWPSPQLTHPATLEVTALDVGQGDSLLVVGPTGKTMLIDAGGPTGAAANSEIASGSSSFDIGEEVVSPYLWSRQVRRLDVVALTHAHSDHMGGMDAILHNFRPRELWVSIDPDSAAYRTLLQDASSLGIQVRHWRADDAFLWDTVSVAVLAPTFDYANPGQPTNNDSLVLHLQFGQASVLLEGDAEAPSERTMAASGHLAPVTLLKVGHHGSRTSTTPNFLALVTPRDAIISVGRQNTFGHPRPETVAALTSTHTRLYRTDRFGLTTFLLHPDGTVAEQTAASQ